MRACANDGHHRSSRQKAKGAEQAANDNTRIKTPGCEYVDATPRAKKGTLRANRAHTLVPHVKGRLEGK